MPGSQGAAEKAGPVPGSTKLVLRTADVRVVEYTLAPGEAHPWHHHTEVSDRVYCLEGVIDVDIRTPPAKHSLHPGQSFEVPPGTVHHVGNGSDAAGRYLLIQATGKYDYIRAE